MEHFVSILEQLVNLVEHLAWPALVILAIYFSVRKLNTSQIKSLLAGITNFKIGPSGVEINREVEAIASKMDSLHLRHEQLKALVYKAVRQECDVLVATLWDGAFALVAI